MPPPHGRGFERGGSGGLGQAGGDERAPAEAAAAANKEAPNMELSGKLAAEANKVSSQH